MLMTDFRCADRSFAREEPMFATASRVERWLLVEQAGPFSAETVPASRMSPQALSRLSQLAARARARLVLIRRPPRVGREPGLRVFYADTRPGHARLVGRLLPDQQALRVLTLDDAGWAPVAEPLFLVCTHGKHDPCCALRGRPVVSAIADTLAHGRVWECSHIGGDRFAGNVVTLPSGLYLGRVEAEEAPAVAELIDAGRVPVHYLRGRSALSAPAQAAQHFARTAGGLASFDAIDDLLPLSTESSPDDGPDAWTIRLACPAGEVRVTVRRGVSADPAQLTCHAMEPKHYPRFELVRIRQLTCS